MNKAKILYVDDDQRLCRLVKRYVENHDYDFISAHDANEAHKTLTDNNDVALILLDIMLPDRDGLTLAHEIRNKSATPIIFLTAKAELDDKVSGLEAGADDYITKPFEEKELIARIQTVLRRTQSSQSPQANKTHANFAGWSLNLVNQQLYSPEGKNIDITSTEYRLLHTLISRPNVTIHREEILNILSGREWSPLDRSADMAISKLRKKLTLSKDDTVLIRTIRNKGYQLISEVEFTEAH
ncbi:MAG TPA: response regulator transcription factor [Gammaproteobacteria bacterium]|nr:response regulator transcription factor [Gammaproteobacteria bacterium]